MTQKHTYSRLALTLITVVSFTVLCSCKVNREMVVVNDAYRAKSTVKQVLRGNISLSVADSDMAMLPDLVTMSEYIYQAKAAVNHTPIYNTNYPNAHQFGNFFYRWRRLDHYPPFPEFTSGQKDRSGLLYDIWVSANNEKAVIVFRGTDFWTISDWHTNAFWLSRYSKKHRTQYAEVRDLVPRLVDTIIQVCGSKIKLYATGHSLGGGLAMQAAYVHPLIKKIFTFHTSPVDGYKTIDDYGNRRNVAGKRFYHIYEKGEILAALRYSYHLFKPRSHKDPEMIQLKFNLIRGNIFSEHSIPKFAEALRARSQ